MKKLPVGLQTFRKLREGDYLYADKTKYVYDLASQGKYFFLSRPRRFGKSLLVDTIKEAFEGHRELFDGLWLGLSDFDFTPHPVIRLDMSMFDLSDRTLLRSGVSGSLLRIAAEHGLELTADSPAG
ncbi:MAG: AAA family ATPase, partial [Propionibacteriaceae bacterium]|nr:AAA family ATPase [Propionibacteriaceae bacterium]